jgi:hypothetical protein
MINLKDILEESINIDDIQFTIHAHTHPHNGPQNLISFIPKSNSDKVKLSKRTTNSPTFAVSEHLAQIYTKKTGIKFIPYTNLFASAGEYSIQIDMQSFIKKFIL